MDNGSMLIIHFQLSILSYLVVLYRGVAFADVGMVLTIGVNEYQLGFAKLADAVLPAQLLAASGVHVEVERSAIFGNGIGEADRAFL